MRPNVIRLFVVVATFAASFFPVSFAHAQSDGTSPRPDISASSATSTETAPASTLAPATIETTIKTGALPRVSPKATSTNTSSVAVPTTPRGTVSSTSQTPKSQTNDTKKSPSVSPSSSEPIPPANSFPLVTMLVALAGGLILAPYGMSRLLSEKNSQKKDTEKDADDNKCGEIKKLLEQKKSTFKIVSGMISLKQALIDFLTKKIEEKIGEKTEALKAKAVDTIVGEKNGERIRSVEEAKETYDDLAEKLEQAKTALAYFTDRRRQLNEDIGKIESTYQTCMLGNSLFTGASRLGAGLEIFEAALQQKLYRYVSGDKNVFSPEMVRPEHLMEAVNKNKKWLPTVELPSGEYQFFLTEKGKEHYEKTLFLVHQQYLKDILSEEQKISNISNIVYEDEWQVIAQTSEVNEQILKS